MQNSTSPIADVIQRLENICLAANKDTDILSIDSVMKQANSIYKQIKDRD
jgi:hypothetical protein